MLGVIWYNHVDKAVKAEKLKSPLSVTPGSKLEACTKKECAGELGDETTAQLWHSHLRISSTSSADDLLKPEKGRGNPIRRSPTNTVGFDSEVTVGTGSGTPTRRSPTERTNSDGALSTSASSLIRRPSDDVETGTGSNHQNLL